MSSKIGLKKSTRTNEEIIKWIIRIVLVLFAIVTLFPMLFVLLTSLKTTGEFYTNIWFLPKEFAWENYQYAWEIAKIGEYFVTSVIVVVITVVATLILAAFAGYALAKLKVPQADLIMLIQVQIFRRFMQVKAIFLQM